MKAWMMRSSYCPQCSISIGIYPPAAMMYFESQLFTQFAQLEVSLKYMFCDLQSSVSMEANHNNCLGFWVGVGRHLIFRTITLTQQMEFIHMNAFLINSEFILN